MLKLALYCVDKLGRESLAAEAHKSLGRLELSPSQTHFNARLKEFRPELGELSLSLCYLPTAERLSLKVESAKGLPLPYEQSKDMPSELVSGWKEGRANQKPTSRHIREGVPPAARKDGGEGEDSDPPGLSESAVGRDADVRSADDSAGSLCAPAHPAPSRGGAPSGGEQSAADEAAKGQRGQQLRQRAIRADRQTSTLRLFHRRRFRCQLPP